MITLQGAGAIVHQDDGRVLLVRAERRNMLRWELPSAIRKGEESLFMTVYRCVEEESRHRYRIRIGRPVCLASNRSLELGRSYFGIFFECTLESVSAPGGSIPSEIGGLPASARQNTVAVEFIDWRTLPPKEIHPQHRNILLQWAETKDAGGSLFAVQSDADEERRYYLQEDQAKGTASLPHSTLVESVPYSPPASSGVELSWIQVSDIHFGSTSRKAAGQQKLVLSRLLEDVQREFAEAGADCIFVTGDIAYSGRENEYAESLDWLKKLAETARVPPDRIWFIPGNHDVRRDLVEASSELQKRHKDARSIPFAFDNYFHDPVEVRLLASKLKDYCDWIRGHFPHITDPLDWSTTLTTRRGKLIHLAGLSSVWVSDAMDGGGSDLQYGTLTNNMFVSQTRSCKHLNPEGDQSVLKLLLTHHPRSWLSGESKAWLDMALSHNIVVHMSGHVHEDSGNVGFAAGVEGCYASITAGAVHGGDYMRHSYAWGLLRFDEAARNWHLGWAPRSWTRNGRFTADRTNYQSLDKPGYHWELLARRAPSSLGRAANEGDR